MMSQNKNNMSIGNIKDNGNKGNNFPYQGAVLQLLGQIASGSGNSVTRVTSILRVTNTGTVIAGTKSISFYNAGAISVTIKTIALKPGEQITYSVIGNQDVLDAIAYDATGSELLITTLT